MSESAEFIQDLIGYVRCGFILPSIIKSNISEKLVESSKTVEELAEGTSINPERLDKFLRLLENYGIFSFDESAKKWSNTKKSLHFLNPFVKSSILCELNPKFLELWNSAEEVLLSDKSSLEIQGRDQFFLEIEKFPDTFKVFQNHMKTLTQWDFNEVIEAIDLSSVNKLLDVGGGDGSLAIGLANAYENTQFGVFENEKIKEFADQNIEANGLTNRISAISGNFLENIAEGFDGIALKHIVHDWKDDSVALILKNCRKVLSPGNKLFIIDMIINRNSPYYKYQVQNDLIMTHYFGSKERTLPEFEKLLLEAGFLIENVSEVLFENVIQAVAV